MLPIDLVQSVGGYKDLEWDTGRQRLDQSIRSDKRGKWVTVWHVQCPYWGRRGRWSARHFLRGVVCFSS